jgi:hypothetical protein
MRAVGLVRADARNGEVFVEHFGDDAIEHGLVVGGHDESISRLRWARGESREKSAVEAGNTGALALFVPIGILFLVFAGAIRVMLRTRNRQLRAKS